MKYFGSLTESLAFFLQLVMAVALQSSPVVRTSPGSSSESSPNPIATLYPNQITGTINSTLSVVPISYELAKSIIPKQYGILTAAYHSLLKDFPKDKYPLIIRGALDHGVGIYAPNFSLPDFQKIQILYPFVDILGDGYSSFVYNKYLFLSADSPIAIAGAESDGTIVAPATFSPELDAYAYTHSGSSYEHSIYLNAYTNISTSTKPAVSTVFERTGELGPYSLDFYKNVTNQPISAGGITCDNQINLFNTTWLTGKNAPAGIRGRIKIVPPYFPAGNCEAFEDVFGILVDTAFLEMPGMRCARLKGYHASGPGD